MPGKGLLHRSHARHIKPARAAAAKVLRSYFARQCAAVLEVVKPRIAAALESHPPPLKEAKTPAAKNFAKQLLPASVSPLRFPVTKGESDEWTDAVTGAILGAAKTLSAELAAGDIKADDIAGRYLRDNSLSKLTGNFSDESVKQLQNAIADAWTEGGSYDQIVAAIQDTFAQFSDVRAGMIAQTEINNAYSSSRVDMATAAGFDEKSWDPDGDCCTEICQPNVDTGWIGIDEDFPSGDDAPSAHPNCDCSVSFRKGGPDDE